MNKNLSPLAPIGEVIEKRRKKALIRRDNQAVISSFLQMLTGLVIAVIIFNLLFGFKIISGNDMYPALSDGDLVMTFFKTKLVKNEIIFYEADGKEYVGRVVARGGDNIDFSEDGKFYVNGTVQTTDVVFPTYPPDGWQGITTVPEGTVFVLGDYRTSSVDSRSLGFIPKQNVKSKVITLIRHKNL